MAMQSTLQPALNTANSSPLPAVDDAAHAPPDPASLFLPASYVQQQANTTLDEANPEGRYWQPWRTAVSDQYQHHVYRWAAQLVQSKGLRSTLDVGCGVADKLAPLLGPACDDIVGVDQASAVTAARKRMPSAQFYALNLERPDLQLERTFDLILCCDVLEHLLDPDPALRFIRQCAHARTLILLSTPDRARHVGRSCNRSLKPEHVREWSRGEFLRYLRSRSYLVHSSRLFPQDKTARVRCLPADLLFRARLATRSPLACHAVLCAAHDDDSSDALGNPA